MVNECRYEADCVVVLINRRDSGPLECRVDYCDWERMETFDRTWSAMWNEAGKTFYAFCQNPDRSGPLYLHRWIMDTPPDMEVDHEDYNGLNNRRNNMSNVRHSLNQLNRRIQKNNTSGYRGVVWDSARGKFAAQVKVNGKGKFLGRFASAEEAHAVVREYRTSVLGGRA